MELRQLHILLGVAEHGSFSAAADALHTVQSNVSAHIAHLERELHTTLVDRSTGRLTEQGIAVASRARRITAEVEAVASDIAALNNEVVGTARVGMIGTTARWLVPQLLDLAKIRHPQLRLEVMEATTAALEVPLMTGRLSLAVGTLAAWDSALDFTPLFEEDLILLVPVGSPLVRDSPLNFKELEGIPMLLPLPGTAFRSEIDLAAEAAGVTLTALADIDGTRLLASLTFDGHGPAILPATAVPDYMRKDWALMPMAQLAKRRVGIVRRSRGLASTPAQAVVDLLHELLSPNKALPDGLHHLPSGHKHRGETNPRRH